MLYSVRRYSSIIDNLELILAQFILTILTYVVKFIYTWSKYCLGIDMKLRPNYRRDMMINKTLQSVVIQQMVLDLKSFKIIANIES